MKNALVYLLGAEVKNYLPARFLAGKGVTEVDTDALALQGVAMDALVGPVAPNGFIGSAALRADFPGVVRDLMHPTPMDEIAGIQSVGDWKTQDIRIRAENQSGKAERYTDHGNIPLAEISPLEEIRDVIVFEQGYSVGALEDARLSASGHNAREGKLRATAASLNNARHDAAIFGVAGTRCYGLLNDPNLNPAGVALGAWMAGTYSDLVGYFNNFVSMLETQIGSFEADWPLLLLLPTGYRSSMSVTNLQGMTFGTYLATNYPNLRVKYLAALSGAGAGNLDLGYLIAEDGPENEDVTVSGSVIQLVPARYQTIGSEQRAKSFIEVAIAATAGFAAIRPWRIAIRTTSV